MHALRYEEDISSCQDTALGVEYLLFPGVSLGSESQLTPWTLQWLLLLSLLLCGWLFQLSLLWEKALPTTLSQPPHSLSLRL